MEPGRVLPSLPKIKFVRRAWGLAPAVAIAVITVSSHAPATAAAKPKPVPHTIAAVTAELDRLARGAEALAEKYNQVSAQAAHAARQARVARERSRVAEAAASLAHRKFVAVVTAQDQSGSLGAAGALLTSTDPQSYLDQLTALDFLARQQTAVVSGLQRAERSADRADNQAAQQVKTAEHRRAVVAGQRRAVLRQTGAYKRLLSTLTAAQRRAYANRDAASRRQAADAKRQANPPRSAHSASKHSAPSRGAGSVHSAAGGSAAQRAVQFALAQIGKPYVFAAAGPNSYDCSGLTMAAWKHGGVSLPHLASAQYNYGTHVSADALRPGDLVFFYHPIGHVAIYIGRGLLVSAPQTGENVKIVRLSYFMSDYVGATRLA
jgi:cell wall-associated NlpC family hydrolase